MDIKYIKDNEGNNFFPVVHEKGVVDDNGTTLESKLQSKQDEITTVTVNVDDNTGIPSGSASMSGNTLSFNFSNIKGVQGIQGIQGPQGERGPQGNTGVQVDSVASIIHSIDPTATYAAADVAGADAVQDVLAEVTELAGKVLEAKAQGVLVLNGFIHPEHKFASNASSACYVINIIAGKKYKISLTSGVNKNYIYSLFTTDIEGQNAVGERFPTDNGIFTAPSTANYLFVCYSYQGNNNAKDVEVSEYTFYEQSNDAIIDANIKLSNCKMLDDFVADIVLKDNIDIDFSVYNRVVVSDLYYAANAYYLTLWLQGTDVGNLSLFSQSFSTKAAAESKFGILLESSYCYLVLRHVADGQRYEDITLTFNRDISWDSLNEHPVIKELLLEREILSNSEDIETLQNDVIKINDKLIGNESKSFSFTYGCCYTFTVGQAPAIESNSDYDCVSVDNLHEGDAVVLYARAGTSKVFCAKCLNGVVVSTIQSVYTADNTIECDGTFDSLYVNNYIGYVAAPTATANLKVYRVDLLSEKVEELEEVKTNDAIPQYVSLAIVETNTASYIRRTDGAVMGAATSEFQVRKYAVEANKVYFLSGSTGAGNASCMAAFYTSNGTYIAGSVINPANIYPSTSWERFKVVSPANAAFVKVQRASADNNINAEVISDYASVYSIAQQLLSGNLTGNVLQGKKWAACGDSNTVGDFTGYSGNSVFPSDSKYAGEKMVYPRFIAERNDMNLVMDAVGGSTIALTKAYVDDPTHVDINTRYPFSYERYSEVPLDCDYITLWFGGNDTECYLGEITDETNESVYGAWNVVLRYFITNAPFAKIGIIVPYTSTSTIREAVRNVAKKWGIPYLDMAGDVKVPMMRIRETELGVSSEAETLRQEAYRVSDTNAHMNPLAHRYQSTFIEHWLRSL